MLYQLSYDHHCRAHEMLPVAPDNHSHTIGSPVERAPERRSDLPLASDGRHSARVGVCSSAAMAFAWSTSGPGNGTKIERR